MLGAGGSVKIAATVFSGTSVAMVILLTVYSIVANEETVAVEGPVRPEGFRGTLDFPVTTSPVEFDLADCKKLVMIIAKRALKWLSKCGKELKAKFPDTESFNKHFDCTLKCVMRDVDLLDENGHITNFTAHNFVNKQVPERFHSLAWKLGGPCLEKYSTMLDDKDEYCKEYGNMIKCLQTITDNC